MSLQLHIPKTEGGSVAEIMQRAMRNLALKISPYRTLNATEHRILAYFLAIFPPNLRLEIGHKDVAEKLGVSRPQVSRAMRRLEDKYYFTKLANKVCKFPDRLKTEGDGAAITPGF